MITFIIENGFDLNLGMKTQYTDVYDSYVKSPTENNTLKKFRSRISQDYKGWADFEMGMALEAKNFLNEEEFLLCVRDFKTHLHDYLLKEQENNLIFSTTIPNHLNILAQEMLHSFKSFYKGTTKNAEDEINNVILLKNVNFLTFNYTSVLDKLIAYYAHHYKNNLAYEVSQPIHIHGSLTNEMVTGVDNIEQFHNLKFKITKKIQRAFVKPLFNQEYDRKRVSNALDIIDESRVICSFGWSLGESDRMWINAIKEWLLRDDYHHFIYYYYDETSYPAFNYELKLDREDELRDEILEKFNLTAEEKIHIYDRVHIPVGHKIFNFQQRLNEEVAKVNRPKVIALM